jgi:hypothetical protein
LGLPTHYAAQDSDLGVKKFQDLFLNNLSHRIVKPTLGLLRRYRIYFYRDAMGAKSRVDSLKVLE